MEMVSSKVLFFAMPPFMSRIFFESRILTESTRHFDQNCSRGTNIKIGWCIVRDFPTQRSQTQINLGSYYLTFITLPNLSANSYSENRFDLFVYYQTTWL